MAHFLQTITFLFLFLFSLANPFSVQATIIVQRRQTALTRGQGHCTAHIQAHVLDQRRQELPGSLEWAAFEDEQAPFMMKHGWNSMFSFYEVHADCLSYLWR